MGTLYLYPRPEAESALAIFGERITDDNVRYGGSVARNIQLRMNDSPQTTH